jgi:L-lactate dehydrogenase complex protein LldG
LAHVLAARHVIIVPASCIVPDMIDSGTLLRQAILRGVPYVTYITGPSRTSDIEKVLTIGVHGPGIVDLLIVANRERDAD